MLSSGELEANGRSYRVEYVLTRSRIAKAMVEDDRVIIKVPYSYREKERNEAINSLKQKVVKRLNKDPNWGRLRYPAFYNGQILNLIGEQYTVNILEGTRKRGVLKGNTFIITIPSMPDSEKRKVVFRSMHKLISKAILPKITERVLKINALSFNFEVKKVRLKYAMNRWGSCNIRDKGININILLLFAPDWILDYVIVHELAHIGEPNHSKRFWSIVANAFPRYKDARLWLRRNGRMLYMPGFNY